MYFLGGPVFEWFRELISLGLFVITLQNHAHAIYRDYFQQ